MFNLAQLNAKSLYLICESFRPSIDDVTVGIHPAEVSRLVVYFSIGGLYEASRFFGAFQYPPIT